MLRCKSTCYGKLLEEELTESDLFWGWELGQLLCRAHFGGEKKRVSECQVDLNEGNTVLCLQDAVQIRENLP